MNQIIYNELKHILTEEQIRTEEPMRDHTTFRIGGPAAFFVMPKTAEEVKNTVRLCRERKVPYYIVGNGSNLLVSDQGYEGVIIQIFKQMNRIEVEGTRVFDTSFLKIL